MVSNKKAACVLLIRNDGKLLAASRRGSISDFNLVGGKVDPGETVKEAAVREFYEETGIKLSSENLTPVFERLCQGDTDYDTTTYLVYQDLDPAAMTIHPELPDSPEPGILVRWITWDELCSPSSAFQKYNTTLRENISFMLRKS